MIRVGDIVAPRMLQRSDEGLWSDRPDVLLRGAAFVLYVITWIS